MRIWKYRLQNGGHLVLVSAIRQQAIIWTGVDHRELIRIIHTGPYLGLS